MGVKVQPYSTQWSTRRERGKGRKKIFPNLRKRKETKPLHNRRQREEAHEKKEKDYKRRKDPSRFAVWAWLFCKVLRGRQYLATRRRLSRKMKKGGGKGRWTGKGRAGEHAVKLVFVRRRALAATYAAVRTWRVREDVGSGDSYSAMASETEEDEPNQLVNAGLDFAAWQKGGKMGRIWTKVICLLILGD